MQIPQTREQCYRLLCRAAEWEHLVTCQYLYAAFSLKTHEQEGSISWAQLERVRGWKRHLLRIARQEMEHHGLVCNLMISMGGVPLFRRPAFPFQDPEIEMKPMELLPFGEKALDNFIDYEEARPATMGGYIEEVYQVLYKAIENPAFGQRLFLGCRRDQILNKDLGLLLGHYDMLLTEIEDAGAARKTIERILEAGGDPSTGHAATIREIQADFQQMYTEDPEARPVRNLADPAALSDLEGIPQKALKLFNSAYETMILFLERFYTFRTDSPQELEGLMKTAFFPLMTAVIRPLGEMLTQIPCTASNTFASPSFLLGKTPMLHPDKAMAWILLYERLSALSAQSAKLNDQFMECEQPWAERLAPRVTFLSENLERMAANFRKYMDLEKRFVIHNAEKTFVD